jgi:hypothetical protein
VVIGVVGVGAVVEPSGRTGQQLVGVVEPEASAYGGAGGGAYGGSAGMPGGANGESIAIV